MANQRFHPATNLQRFKLFETMNLCGDHSPTKKYLAMYWLHGSSDWVLNSPLFENDERLHAESHLLNHLRSQLKASDKHSLKSIIIMQDASPCCRCADSYIKGLGHLIRDHRLFIVIVFSSLYGLRRLSCLHHSHPSVNDLTHEGSKQGLLSLVRAGFLLRSTCQHDWAALAGALQVPVQPFFSSERNYHLSLRGVADKNLLTDLLAVLLS